MANGYEQHLEVQPPPISIGHPAQVDWQGRRYELIVGQEPVRARMCGFGDKDRRPITPPPCVRLRVYDNATNEEITADLIDCDFFVLLADLWDSARRTEVNIVRHSNSSPAMSISAATTTSYPPQPDKYYVATIPSYGGQQHAYMMATQPSFPQPMSSYVPVYNGYSDPTPYYSQHAQLSNGGGYHTPSMHASHPAAQHQHHHQQHHPHQQQQMQAPQHHHVLGYQAQMASAQGSHTRNLIGSLAVPASKLKDESGTLGIWFVFQDLSVRTEGNFTLKFTFMDVNDPQRPGHPTQDDAPILATQWTQSFQVYSAKKFPGVIESTPLSKSFAQQGVKIPIRKDGTKTANAADFDGDNDDPSMD